MWVIPETGEWFLKYEDYLNRMSFYNVKKFVCETSGNSNFTFFEALKVEHNELFSMQSNFPEPVKEPILRHVSFSTVPRIDLLVDQVYTKFKDDFFPGDKVIVKYTGGYRAHGIVKEKVVFNSRMDSNGVIQSPFISYRIFLPADENEVVIEDASLIYRERNRFTKSYVKTFLKMSLVRSNRLGAPWVIRDEIAKKYKISLEWPADMKKVDYVSQNTTHNRTSISILNDDDNDDDSLNDLHRPKFVPMAGPHSTPKQASKQRQKQKQSPHMMIENGDAAPLSAVPTQGLSKSQMGIFNQNENSLDYGMRSSRGFSHTVFENLKETPPAYEDLYDKWCEQWYQILRRTTAYFEDLKTEDRARDKVIKLFEFAGVKIVDTFDPDNTHFIVTQRPFVSKEAYPESDPFSYVHMKRIKVWHYEKCQRFFKSIRISNRRIDQLAKQRAIQKGIEVIDYLSGNGSTENNGNITNQNEDSFTVNEEEDSHTMQPSAQSKSFVNIAPAPTIDDHSNGKTSGNGKGKGRAKGKGRQKPISDTASAKENEPANSKKSNSKTAKPDEKNNKPESKTDDSKSKAAETKIENEQADKKSHKPVIVDDLLLPIKYDVSKPNWKVLSGLENLHFDFENCPITTSNVLEVWIFINMFHEAFVIDTFTFDDFLYALQWNDPSKKSPLLLEIFCALLSCIISKEGELLITLPVDIQSEIEEKEAEMKEKKLAKEREKKEKDKKSIKVEDDEDDEVENEDEDEENENENEGQSKENGNGTGVQVKEEGKENAGAEKSFEVKEESEKDDDDDDDDDINHNAYSILDYKKLSWRERLQKRHFKEGQWLIILMGIFSITEFIPEYKNEITKTYELLAPLDEVPTPETLMANFCEKVSPVRRVSMLSILMGLLLGGEVVRAHTDFVVSRSASLRRERFELQKELKLKVESAHIANKDVLDSLRTIDVREIKQRIEDRELEALTTEEEKEKWIEIKNRGGRPIQNTLPPEPSALEKAVAAGHPEFLKLLSARTEKISEVESMKKQRLEIDRTLVELNCQRIRYLGRDKVWNRYWWFEKNGLPNLGGNKDDDDENDEIDREERDDADNGDDDESGDLRKKDDNSEYDSETYLMGRIWIQGPSAIDVHHLRGGDGTGLKRKMIEEGENILKNERDWVFIDQVEDFNKLVSWLNDKGLRERALKKELNECRDRVISSFKARRNFLKGGESQIKLSNYIKKLEEGAVNEKETTKEETEKVEVMEIDSEDDRPAELDVGDEEAEEEEENGEDERAGDKDQKDHKKEEDEVLAIDSDSDSDTSRVTRSTRSLRNRKPLVVEEKLRRSKRNAAASPTSVNTRSKRRRVNTSDSSDDVSLDGSVDAGTGNDDENDDSTTVEPEFDDETETSKFNGKTLQSEEGYIDRMVRLLQLPGSDDPPELRTNLLIRARAKLGELDALNREENMILWVNSAAIEKNGYTHYEGPRIINSSRASRGNKKGRASKSSRGSRGRGRGRQSRV